MIEGEKEKSRAISFNCGVVLCQEYEHIDGTFYSKFILEYFATIIERSKKRSRLFIQDGDPSQSSTSARNLSDQAVKEKITMSMRIMGLRRWEVY